MHRHVTFDGTDVLALRGAELRRHRAQVAVVFQDPRAHINPVRRIERLHDRVAADPRRRARPTPARRAADALEEVGIDDPASA